MTTDEDAPPAPTPAPVVSTGPFCAACGELAAVNWARRPTADEVTEVIKTELLRREQLLLLADPQLPAPDFGPLPTGDGMTRTVYACVDHAISLDGASLIHACTCTAPNPADLPDCDCTPEVPDPEPMDDPLVARMVPAHWTTGA
ncbi:hypothetical protein ACGF3G_00380 [Streptomyces sp. NPDC048179]|uniref:hypothetical protein n=1 Tax=Streptomyces sp. NPDC048179 TaxID=3365506 RepID=UPI0037185A23